MKILVPTAGEEAAREIADYVVATALSLDAEIVALHILSEDETPADGRRACQVFKDAGAERGVTVTGKSATGPVSEAIVESAESLSVELIVMGASRGSVVRNWLSARVSNECQIPVLVVPHCYQG